MAIDNKEYLFRLQVFQQTISTLCMYPLRLYKNSCYDTFVNDDKFQTALKEIHTKLGLKDEFDSTKVLHILKEQMARNPRKISQDIYVLLELFGEALRESMWATKPSNSLTFTRDIKENKKLWFSLMFYDIFSIEEIKEFEKPFERECLVGMHNIFVKVNDMYTLSVGRILTKEQESDEIVSNIFENYDFDNINIFELTKVSRQRKIFHEEIIYTESQKLQKCFSIFLNIIGKLPSEIPKKEIEKVAIFIYMIVKDELEETVLYTLNYKLTYNNAGLFLEKNINVDSKKSSEFGKYIHRFENYRDFFLDEHTSRIKTSFNKKYSGVRHEEYGFNPINDLIGRICSRLNADTGCYIKYSLYNEKLKLIASYGDQAYVGGIKNLIVRINAGEEKVRNQSRVLKIINNYYNPDCQHNINKLIIQDIDDETLLLPIADKYIRSNIAIPVTFRYKLLGILLIDSFRKDSFTKDDVNLTLSITSTLSVQIFDQIIEHNLFNIIKSVPNKAVLGDEKLLDERFAKLTRYLNRIFFSYGVAIWQYDEKELSFLLKSTTLNIKDNNVRIKKGSNNFILDILKNYKNNNLDPLSEFNIAGSTRFNCCNPRDYDDRLNAIKIYPIVEDGKLLGAFSIYNRRESDYRAIDVQSLVSVNAHLKVFFSIISTFRQQRALIENNALHEISKKLMMVENKTLQLGNILDENARHLDHYARHRFAVKLNDIDNFRSDIKQSFDFIANKSDGYMGKNFVDKEVENKYLPAQESAKYHTLCIREMTNQLINSIPVPLCNKKIRIKNNVNKTNVYIAHSVLNDIFQNLLFNAMKYSFQKTDIVISSKIKEHGLYILFKNEGLDITLDERDDIFKYGYRCSNAKKFKETIDDEQVNYEDGEEQNAGIGLYKVHALLKNVLSGEVKLKKESSSFRNGAKITFQIVLPIRLVKKRK